MPKDKQVPHLQVGKPKYQEKIDEVNANLKGNAPDNGVLLELLQHIMEEQHEIKLMLKRTLGPSN